MSMTPFFKAERVSSSSERMICAVRRISSVASAKRWGRRLDDVDHGRANDAGSILGARFGAVQRIFQHRLERAHQTLDVFRLLDQADGQIFQRLLAIVERRDKVRLRRAQNIGRGGEQLAVLVEASGDSGDSLQRLRRQFGQPGRVGIEQARRAGECLRRPFRRCGEGLRRIVQLPVHGVEAGRRKLDQFGKLIVRLRQTFDEGRWLRLTVNASHWPSG
jgi:hypothetical protein